MRLFLHNKIVSIMTHLKLWKYILGMLFILITLSAMSESISLRDKSLVSETTRHFKTDNNRPHLGFGFYKSVRLYPGCRVDFYLGNQNPIKIDAKKTTIKFRYVDGKIQPDVLSKLTFSDARIGSKTYAEFEIRNMIREINHFKVWDFLAVERVANTISLLESHSVTFNNITHIGPGFFKGSNTSHCTQNYDHKQSEFPHNQINVDIYDDNVMAKLTKSRDLANAIELRKVFDRVLLPLKKEYSLNSAPIFHVGLIALVALAFTSHLAFIALVAMNGMYFLIVQDMLNALFVLLFVPFFTIFTLRFSIKSNLVIASISLLMTALLTDLFMWHTSPLVLILNAAIVASLFSGILKILRAKNATAH